MAFEKRTFEDGVTPLDAELFNHLQDGIAAAHNITLSLHTDGLLYVFIDGVPVGNGVELQGGSGSGDDDSSIPTYYYTETARVINLIEAFKAEHPNHLIFGAVSDIHISSGEDTEEDTKKSIQHAAYALEVVGSAVGCDFIVNLGDNCEEGHIDPSMATETSPSGLENAEYAINTLKSAFDKLESFNLVGNHDKSNHTEDQYNLIGVHNDFDVSSTTKIRGFGRYSNESKNVRVIVLNTCDYLNASGGCALSYEQKDFLMRSLDLSAYTNPTEWQILLLSHIPLDWSTEGGNDGTYNFTVDLQEILTAYEYGTTAEITVNSSYALNETPSEYATYSNGKLVYNYSGKNSAKIIANIHGHIHNNKVGKIANTNIVRVATPNTSPYGNASTNRYSEYGDYSITEEEAAKIVKVSGTAKDTSATFYCIDLDKQVIYAYGYGADINRTIVYSNEANAYNVTHELTNCELIYVADTIVHGEPYEATLQPDSGFEMSEVVITMGNVDITETAYNASDGSIYIAEVTGHVIIMATAIENYVPHWDIGDRTAVSDMYKGANDAKVISRNNYYWGAFDNGPIYGKNISSCSVNGNDVTFTPTSDRNAGIGVPFHLEAGAKYTFSATATSDIRLRWCVLNADGTFASAGTNQRGTSPSVEVTAPTDTSQWVMLILGGYTVDQSVTVSNITLTKNDE